MIESTLFFGSAGDERGTPQDFYAACHREFGFTLDVAATTENAKCDLWLGPGGVAEDALVVEWGEERCWMNPPYSLAAGFVEKAATEATKGAFVAALLPVRSDTKWWHSHVWDARGRGGNGDWRTGVRGRLLPGRLSFELRVSEALREHVCQLAEASLVGPAFPGHLPELLAKAIGKQVNLPKMAIDGIWERLPDDELLGPAPFPSCLILFGDA